MKLVVDAQLPELLVAVLTEAGYDACHVRSSLPANAGDGEIWTFAATFPDAVIITRDADFMRLLRDRPGNRVIWLRIGNCGNASLIDLMLTRLDGMLRTLTHGDPYVEVYW